MNPSWNLTSPEESGGVDHLSGHPAGMDTHTPPYRGDALGAQVTVPTWRRDRKKKQNETLGRWSLSGGDANGSFHYFT